MTAATTAAKFLTDNRTAIGGKDDTGARIAILPTLPDGLAFTALAQGGDATGTENAATPTAPAGGCAGATRSRRQIHFVNGHIGGPIIRHDDNRPVPGNSTACGIG